MITRYLPLSIRAYAEAPAAHGSGAGPLRPSRWSLVFDCETTMELEQQLRFGMYRVYKDDVLQDAGAFAGVLPPAELDTLRDYCRKNELELRTLDEFISEVLYEVGYRLQGSVIGFNLPFDISRLAKRWAPSRRRMLGGWTFYLAEEREGHGQRDWWELPPIQIRSLSHRKALIRFAATHRTGRAQLSRGLQATSYRGHFVDVHSFAAALLGASFTLESLCEAQHVEHPKLSTKTHGKVTTAYLRYAERDVLATWECYQALSAQLAASGLTVQPSMLYSEAGVARSILRQLGVRPWRECQPGFPPDLLGIIWSTYYAGRSELRLRRTPKRCAYLDFTSEYPTVAILLNVWRFATASGVTWKDDTEYTREFLESVTLDDLLNPDTWRELPVLVQLHPNEDILPARGPYAGQGEDTIGENYVTSSHAMWYTLAHAIASKLRTGKAPKVLRAIRFAPGPLQDGLRPIELFGRTVKPTDDVYRVLIEHRAELRHEGKEHEQLALKLAVNSLAAGLFSEIHASTRADPDDVKVHYGREALTVKSHYVEEPGVDYHPLLATLVTGGGRLLLAMLETMATKHGMDWAMCDTDSMVLTDPSADQWSMHTDWGTHTEDVVLWIVAQFELLNPYSFDGLLKVEHIGPFFFGISAKRYCLYGGQQRDPMMVKCSGHSLGYMASPVEPWPLFCDLDDVPGWHEHIWRRIVQAHPGAPDYSDLPGFRDTAIMHYAVTRPSIEAWLPLRPFSFLTVMEGVSQFSGVENWKAIRPIAPFTRDPREAEGLAVDRRTRLPLREDVALLATYQDALADYHVHPAAPFDVSPHAAGYLPRIQVVPDGFRLVGKEANLADERAVFGSKDMDAVIEYATLNTAITSWKDVFAGVSLARLGASTGFSKGYLSRLLSGDRELTDDVREKFQRAARELTSADKASDCSPAVSNSPHESLQRRSQ